MIALATYPSAVTRDAQGRMLAFNLGALSWQATWSTGLETVYDDERTATVLRAAGAVTGLRVEPDPPGLPATPEPVIVVLGVPILGAVGGGAISASVGDGALVGHVASTVLHGALGLAASPAAIARAGLAGKVVG